MDPSSTLILTKLRPPAPRLNTVQRARLLQKLALEPGLDLALVCAPAGYGKTTLLVDWTQQLRQAGVVVCWYALDESDNHPVTFGAYLVACLEQALGLSSSLTPLRQVLRSSTDVDLLTLLPTLINALCSDGREMVLVLDDYHLVRLPVIHRAVEFLISRRPENFHVAIGSRSNPALPLARWRARGRLVELRASDLCFTMEETRHFLSESMQLDLSGELIIRLAEQVEGWPAGLQLAALSLPRHAMQEQAITLFSGNQRSLAEFLLNEVVNQLPEEVQSFLLETSILDRMAAMVCNAILDIDNSAAMFAQLEQANLFIICLDEGEGRPSGGTWYRYHHLFRDFLRTWLTSTQPERAAQLHRAAAEWFAAHDRLHEGATHAFRSGDWAYAAEYVEQHSFAWIINSDIAAIYTWSSTIPETLLRKRPKLCVFQALALAYRFQAKYRSQVEVRLRQASQAMRVMDSPEEATGVQEFSAVIHTFLAMIPDHRTDATQLLQLAQTGLAAYPPGDPGRFPWLLIAGYAYLALNCPEEAKHSIEEALPLALQSGLFFGMVEATFHLASLACSQGRLYETLEISRSAQREFSALSKQSGLVLPALGCLEVAEGCILMEQDQLEAAEEHLRQGLERMGWGMNPYYLMSASLGLARLYEIQGRLAEALAIYDRLEAFWPDIQLITQGYRVQARLHWEPEQAGPLEAARDWLQDYHAALGERLPVFGLGPVGAAEAYYQANLIWMRLQILLGKPHAVQPYIDEHLRLAQEKDLTGREIELTLIQAQMYHQQGQADQAMTSLEHAVGLSRPRGYLRVFDQNPVLDELIHLSAQRLGGTGYLAQVLFAIRRTRGGGGQAITNDKKVDAQTTWMPSIELIEPLSRRELDVLQMIASGASNQSIADQLVITVGTVKSHIHHIFSKLNARNRTEAVAKARTLGLIEKD